MLGPKKSRKNVRIECEDRSPKRNTREFELSCEIQLLIYRGGGTPLMLEERPAHLVNANPGARKDM